MNYDKRSIFFILIFIFALLSVFIMFGCEGTIRPHSSAGPKGLYSEGAILTPDGRGVLGDNFRFFWLDTDRKGQRIFVSESALCMKSSNSQHQDKGQHIQCMKEKGYQPVPCNEVVKYVREEVESGAVKPNIPPEHIYQILLDTCENAE